MKKTRYRKSDINSIDVYLSIGGSIFQILTRKHQILRMIKILKLIKLKNKGIKIATLGSNLGPFSSKVGTKLTEWELRQNDLVTVRDKYSKKH
ncbi:polysaccharide pyruvyl transferase family protein [Tepidibacillus marianensis]|uniref:polysaccharide pyruvyl transferase family protein n=1 Tax=Tepidibacillus marianensis TaxID=3131995 RepID=UPI0033901D0A